MSWPALDPSIEVHSSVTDIDDLWDRFEIFEAMHHTQHICNPMTSEALDEIVAFVRPGDKPTVVDIGCGTGELLLRCHEQGLVDSVGLDLSPWMLQTAAARSRRRLGADRPHLVLAEGSRWEPASPVDVAVCVGAEWIWHGASGTLQALRRHVASGGRIVFGGPRLHFDADPTATSRQFGKLDTAADVEAMLADVGLAVHGRIDPGEQGWLDYLERGRADALAWAERHPGERADRYLQENLDWRNQYLERDRAIVGWSVWLAVAA